VDARGGIFLVGFPGFGEGGTGGFLRFLLIGILAIVGKVTKFSAFEAPVIVNEILSLFRGEFGDGSGVEGSVEGMGSGGLDCQGLSIGEFPSSKYLSARLVGAPKEVSFDDNLEPFF
jgi:hypothetical protein